MMHEARKRFRMINKKLYYLQSVDIEQNELHALRKLGHWKLREGEWRELKVRQIGARLRYYEMYPSRIHLILGFYDPETCKGSPLPAGRYTCFGCEQDVCTKFLNISA